MHTAKMATVEEESTSAPVTTHEPLAVQEPTITQQIAVPRKTFDISTSDCNDCTFLKGWRLYITTLGYARIFLGFY
jgi:hypothetical protein